MMIRRFLWLILIATTFTLLGCESQEQAPSKEIPHQAVKPEKTFKADTSTPVQAKTESASQAPEQTEQNGDDNAATAKEPVGKSTTTAENAAKEAAAPVVQDLKPVEKHAEELVDKAKDMTEKAATAVQEPTIPEQIVLAASYGNVTFPHKFHADSFECSTCHGDGTPAAFGINKDIAHRLCKGCHAERGEGPTGCKGCHVK